MLSGMWSFTYTQDLNALEKSLKEAQKKDDDQAICRAYIKIGDYYANQDEWKKANKNYSKALDKAESAKFQEGMAAAKNGIGTYYLYNKEDYQTAKKYFEEAQRYASGSTGLSNQISSNLRIVNDKLAQKKSGTDKSETAKGPKREDMNVSDEAERMRQLEEENKRKQEEMKKLQQDVKMKKTSSEASEFLERIKHLSAENQMIAMKLEIKQQEINKNQMEIEKNNMEIDMLNKKRKMKEMELAQQEAESEKLQAIIWSIVFVCGVLALLVFMIFRSYREKKKTNELLLTKNKQIEESSKKIMDSIQYAKKIQEAILTPPDLAEEVLHDHFILYKPKDIVSGDFYWAYKIHNKYAIWMVADCTGHGVPGAFMSMIGNSLLNEIIIERNIISADKILDELKESLIKALGQAGVTGEVRDGMDAALCVWNKETNVLEFAGAFNPLYLVRKGELQSIDADRKPVGWHFAHENSPFTKKEIKLQKGDALYLFSDGYMDQFGGESGKKFSRQRFKNLLIDIFKEDVQSQKKILDMTIEDWRTQAHEEQVDDICVIGVKV